VKKQSLVNIVNELPKEFKLDDLIEKLVVIEKIETGIEDVKKERTVSHEKVKKELKRWSK
jgi:hypothetical protein